MACDARVVVMRDNERKIKSIDLVCDGVCTGGRCRKVQADERPAEDHELERYGITPREGYKYSTFVERCACVDDAGHVRPPAAGELERCCQAALRRFVETPPPEKPTPDMPFVLSYSFIVKTVIICEKREGADCVQCACERFKVVGPVQEVVDENGEVIGTAESVICRCI